LCKELDWQLQVQRKTAFKLAYFFYIRNTTNDEVQRIAFSISCSNEKKKKKKTLKIDTHTPKIETKEMQLP
jgi:hypothetical protein